MQNANILNFLGVIIIILLLVFFHSRGWVPYDEGWFVAAADRSNLGESIYQDYLFLYNPGGVWMNQIGMSVFGRSILATRIMAGVNALAAMGIIFLISKQLGFSRLDKILATGIYLFWGPGIINFGWPVMWCLTGALANGLFVSQRKFFRAGIMAALIFIFKQNFGLAILAANVIYWLINRDFRRAKYLKGFIRGYALVIILVLAYFAQIGSMNEYLRQIWYFTVERIFLAGALKSPWPWEYPLPLYKLLPKLAMYLLPAVIAIWGIFKLDANKKIWALILANFWLLSIRPTTDLIHLAPLLALTGVVMAVSKKTIFGMALIMLLGGGIFQSLWGRYYRWNTPLAAQNVYVNHPRVTLFVDKTAAASINKLTLYFEKFKSEEKYLFVYSFSPMWYPVLNKQNPTKYDYLHSGVITIVDEKMVISSLIKNDVLTILTDHEVSNEKNLISEFIRQRFSPEYRVNEYTIWKKSPGPYLTRLTESAVLNQ